MNFASSFTQHLLHGEDGTNTIKCWKRNDMTFNDNEKCIRYIHTMYTIHYTCAQWMTMKNAYAIYTPCTQYIIHVHSVSHEQTTLDRRQCASLHGVARQWNINKNIEEMSFKTGCFLDDLLTWLVELEHFDIQRCLPVSFCSTHCSNNPHFARI
jgi:hypothetical protein